MQNNAQGNKSRNALDNNSNNSEINNTKKRGFLGKAFDVARSPSSWLKLDKKIFKATNTFNVIDLALKINPLRIRSSNSRTRSPRLGTSSIINELRNLAIYNAAIGLSALGNFLISKKKNSKLTKNGFEGKINFPRMPLFIISKVAEVALPSIVGFKEKNGMVNTYIQLSFYTTIAKGFANVSCIAVGSMAECGAMIYNKIDKALEARRNNDAGVPRSEKFDFNNNALIDARETSEFKELGQIKTIVTDTTASQKESTEESKEKKHINQLYRQTKSNELVINID